MVEFLLGQQIELTRVSYWPDYYDERPGGLESGRGVVAKLFDVNQLGSWKAKLRLNWLRIPASHDEALTLKTFKQSWRGRIMMARIALRIVVGKLLGKHWNAIADRRLANAEHCPLIDNFGIALPGEQWADGFVAGIEMRRDAWAPAEGIHHRCGEPARD